MHHFSSGPKITVFFVPDEQTGFKVEISPSEHFSTSFLIDIKSSLRQNFLVWLEAYGKKTPPPMDFLPRQTISSFQGTVLDTLIKVPFGTTVSYGQLATLSGHPHTARAVGTVCKKNKLPLFIPCHRVIQSSGSLGEFAFGSPLKKALLDFEASI